MTAFDFNESEVGPYGEVVMSVIVSPLVQAGERLPKSAFYPYLVATTTKAARDHAIERWHLPHWMEDVEVEFEREKGQITATVAADGAPVAELTISDYSWKPVSHLYQSFMKDDGTYLANILMEGQQSEHEEETGQARPPRPRLQQGPRDLRGLRDPVPRAVDARRLQLFDPLASASTGPLAGASRLRRLQPALGQGPGRALVPAGARRPAPARASSSTASPRRGRRGAPRPEAIARGFRRIVAVGGDGTWSNVGNAILRSGVPASWGWCRAARAATSPSPSASRRATSRPAPDGSGATRARSTSDGRGPLLPEHRRLRLRHRGHRGLLERLVPNIASIAGLYGNPPEWKMGTAAYNTSKGALIALTRALAAEWGAHNINVNAICPGFFPSKMTAATLDRIEAMVVKLTPLGRLGGDEDLMGSVVFLASEASRHITGQAIAVDGGCSVI